MDPRLRRLVALTLLVLAAAVAPATAGTRSKLHKLDLALRGAAARASEPQRVIIQTVPGRRPALRAALIAHGDVVEAEHPMLEAMTAYVHGEDLVPLNDDRSVRWISCDCEVSVNASRSRSWKTRVGTAASVEPPSAPSEIRQLLGLDLSSSSLLAAKGSGIGVAIIDSGIEPSKDLQGRIDGFWDFTRGGGPTKAYDDYGHGTHIAGLIGSSGVLSSGKYQGVAPEARLLIFKVLDRHGRGRTSTVIRALEYITANKEKLRIDVVNLSLGHPVMEPAERDPLVQAVEAAVRAGLVVAVAAGNNGYNPETGEVGYFGINSPGNAPSAITSGAAATQHTLTRRDDRVARFSSRGPTWYDLFSKPDVVAPGVGLVSNLPRRSTLAREHPEVRVDSYFGALSGTSMASAVTAGVVALVMEASQSRLTPNAVKMVVQYTATPLCQDDSNPCDPYDHLTQGTGETNGEGAVRLASTINPSAPVGHQWIGGIDPYTYFGSEEERTSWAQNIVWGSYLVDDPRVAYIHSQAWNDNIVWGTEFERDAYDNIVWGSATFVGDDNIVWGTVDFGGGSDNIVWGTADEWSDNIVWGNSLLGIDDGDNIVWGSDGGNDNIVWGTLSDDNIVWGSLVGGGGDNIVWGSASGDNIVWGTSDGDNIVWGTSSHGGGSGDDNIVWGSDSGDNIVWGSAAPTKRQKRR